MARQDVIRPSHSEGSLGALSALSHLRVLVTGGTGFIGSHVAARAGAEGAMVYVLARPNSDRKRLEALGCSPRFVEGDLTDGASLESALRSSSPDIVLHLAAEGVGRPDEAEAAFRTNIMGTHNLLQAVASVAAPPTFVFVGSCFEYASCSACSEDDVPQPANLYGVTKVSAWWFTQYWQRVANIRTVSVRPFQTYGPLEPARRLVPYAVSAALAGEPARIRTGGHVRDFVFVEDVAEGVLRAAVTPSALGHTLNLGTGVPTPVGDAVEEIYRAVGSSPLITVDRPARVHQAEVLVADTARCRTSLQWVPQTTFKDGIGRTIHWARKHPSWWAPGSS